MSEFWKGFVLGLLTIPLFLLTFATVARTLGVGGISIKTYKDDEDPPST